MSRTAFTVKAFAVYLFILGVLLIGVPNVLLSIFGVPQTSEVWIRVVGVVVFNIGVFSWTAAKHEDKAFFRASVHTRFFVLAAFAAFALLGLASPMLVLFGSVDFVGAIWTHLTLKAEERGRLAAA